MDPPYIEEQKSEMLVQFLAVTGMEEDALAIQHLAGTEWDLQAALDNFFAGGEPRVAPAFPPRAESPPPIVSPRGEEAFDDSEEVPPFIPPGGLPPGF
eukprot:CAMPEP_0206216194 /NCGR_PEP_ID=MMETSP0047_2-20121206/2592_1 /ASSEMBLY_ACC=CAM_ASM_000192 /TAXON_ID=195065 /ORGANISM="Chroomonas mesostigmatica_cf, Strain CCMP1168" /LENGTH=97 /DNA_ID=CAMNT_0053638527 /DNA_START=165 /DNA_END=455 /DNA_ORIENTATION=-